MRLASTLDALRVPNSFAEACMASFKSSFWFKGLVYLLKSVFGSLPFTPVAPLLV